MICNCNREYKFVVRKKTVRPTAGNDIMYNEDMYILKYRRYINIYTNKHLYIHK